MRVGGRQYGRGTGKSRKSEEHQRNRVHSTIHSIPLSIPFHYPLEVLNTWISFQSAIHSIPLSAKAGYPDWKWNGYRTGMDSNALHYPERKRIHSLGISRESILPRAGHPAGYPVRISMYSVLPVCTCIQYMDIYPWICEMIGTARKR